MDNPVEYRSIDHNADIIFCVYCLIGHIHDFCFELHHLNLLCARVDIVESGLEELLKFAEVLEKANCRCFDALIGAAEEPTDASEARNIFFVPFVARHI